MRNEEVTELTKLRDYTSAGGRSIQEIDKAFVEYKQTMNTQVLESLEPVKKGFESFEKRLILAETKLNNLSSDHLVTYLKETKTNSEQDRELEEWKADVQAKIDNLQDKLPKLSQFKGRVEETKKTGDSGFKNDPMKTGSKPDKKL